MSNLAEQVNMDMDVELEARHFRHNLNSKLKDVKLKFERLQELSKQAIDKVDENSWQCWQSLNDLNNRVFDTHQEILKTLFTLQEYVYATEDVNREIVRRSHKYTFGYCERHNESFKNSQNQCDFCLDEIASHSEFLGTAQEDQVSHG